MAGSIPPLVSSSPPPLCAFDDDEEEEEDEFGMYNAVEEIDYSECITFKKGRDKPSVGKSGGEQDSTSQDSATDSGLCPDSEGVSPTPHSDDERNVKQSACDRLCAKPADLPVLLTPKCHSDHSDSLNTSSVLLQSIPHTGLPNGHVDVQDHTHQTESDDDFGNFEVAPTSSVQLTNQGIESNEAELNLRQLETEESYGSKDSTTGENLEEEQSTLNLDDQIPDLAVEYDKKCEVFSRCDDVEADLDPQNTFYCEFPAFEKQDLSDEQETKKDDIGLGHENNDENITSDVKMVLKNDVHQEAKAEDSNFENEDDEFEDFTDFKASFSNSVDFPEPELSDTFSEHLKPLSEQGHLEEAAGKSFQLPQQDESDDEGSNFADFSSSDCAFVSAQSSNSLDNVSHIPLKLSDDTDLRTESDFQDWVSAFPGDVAEPSPGGNTILLREDDVVWTRLFPLESSPALSYQWAESLANRRLLSSLNIDSRNILFMPWSNSAVPRFAANLSCGPLEPVKATEPLQPAPQPTPALQSASLPSSVQESVPAAHFDWVSSGLTNPLDYPKPVLILRKTLSTEAENILALLPDLSFMRKTYIDFPINKG